MYSLTMVTAENRVAAAAFSTVYVYNWKETKQELEEDCFYEGCILALYMKAKGDFVLVSRGGKALRDGGGRGYVFRESVVCEGGGWQVE